MSVHFSYADRSLSMKGKRRLQRFLVWMAEHEGKAVDNLQYVFCSDDFLLGINQQFLQHDDFTDIITFDLGSGKGHALLGEIYISVDRVGENARNYGVSFSAEVQRVIFHGLLHLLGYGDKRKSEIAVMRNKEDEYLGLYADWKG